MGREEQRKAFGKHHKTVQGEYRTAQMIFKERIICNGKSEAKYNAVQKEGKNRVEIPTLLFHPSWEEETEVYALQPKFIIIQGLLILKLYLKHSIT